MPALCALAERRHRLVRAPRLRLAVADLPLLAPPALQAGADALLLLGHHGVIQVLLLQRLVLRKPLGGLELLRRHLHEGGGRDFAGEDARAELRVRLVFQVLEQGAEFLAVGVGGCSDGLGGIGRVVVCVGGGFDGEGSC